MGKSRRIIEQIIDLVGYLSMKNILIEWIPVSLLAQVLNAIEERLSCHPLSQEAHDTGKVDHSAPRSSLTWYGVGRE
jgi:hypothetical protein